MINMIFVMHKSIPKYPPDAVPGGAPYRDVWAWTPSTHFNTILPTTPEFFHNKDKIFSKLDNLIYLSPVSPVHGQIPTAMSTV